ncbi:transposase [Candidatus Daviesbacteria bacterium]|nr:transposase [Candidatus Daviesbacteria bacterium]
MPYRTTPLVSDHFYHIYNRGVEKRIIFTNEKDYQRFLKTLYYYQFIGPKPSFSKHLQIKVKYFSHNPKIVEVICYCLMPNHFHLLIKQTTENGISEFIGKVINSYTKYFNTKYKRVGPLFQGAFKTVLVENDFQMMHLSRYIHLNPYVSALAQNLQQYPYSSYNHFIGLTIDPLCVDDLILGYFKDRDEYRDFVEGHGDYAKELELMKHMLLEEEE